MESQRKALETLKAFGIDAYDEYEWWSKKKKIGLIVNPIAGMGGKVGLKGTDGKYYEAVRLGAEPVAPLKAIEFLKFLKPYSRMFELITCPKFMGEYEVTYVGLKANVISDLSDGEIGKTTPEDTKKAAKKLMNSDLLIFVGGDGTARDVYEVVGDRTPVLGIPSGVKMHSAVFALNPKAAANVVLDFFEEKDGV